VVVVVGGFAFLYLSIILGTLQFWLMHSSQTTNPYLRCVILNTYRKALWTRGLERFVEKSSARTR
jgi:hypothetical protein